MSKSCKWVWLSLIVLVPMLAGAAAPDAGPAGVDTLDGRLDRWIGQIRAEDAGSPPWMWKEFELAASTNWQGMIDRLVTRTPEHNPVVRFWLAAARVAVEAPEAQRAMVLAREELAKYLPEKVVLADRALTASFKAAGIKYVLRLLLDDAARDLRVCEEREMGRLPGTPPSLAEFLRLTGWFSLPMGRADDMAIDCRCWMEENYDRLSWDSTRRRFVGAPAPGPELLEQFARTYGMEIDARKMNDSASQLKALGEIVAVMQANVAAAKDPAAAELVLGMIEPAWLFNGQQRAERQIYMELPRSNRDLGVRVWSRWLMKRLRPIKVTELWRLSSCLGSGTNAYDYSLVSEACLKILPDLQRAREAAVGQPLNVRFVRTMACLYAGGAVPLDEAKGLLSEAGRDGRLDTLDALQWLDASITMGRLDGLDLLLHLAAVSPADKQPVILQRFEHRASVNWQNRIHGDKKTGTAFHIRRYVQWLEQRRASLVFRPEISRFEPVPPDPVESRDWED